MWLRSTPFRWILKIKITSLLPGYDDPEKFSKNLSICFSPTPNANSSAEGYTWSLTSCWPMFPGKRKVHSEIHWVIILYFSHKLQNNTSRPHDNPWTIKVRCNLLIKICPNPLYTSFNCSNKNITSWIFWLNQTFINLLNI